MSRRKFQVSFSLSLLPLERQVGDNIYHSSWWPVRPKLQQLFMARKPLFWWGEEWWFLVIKDLTWRKARRNSLEHIQMHQTLRLIGTCKHLEQFSCIYILKESSPIFHLSVEVVLIIWIIQDWVCYARTMLFWRGLYQSCALFHSYLILL